MNRSGFAGGLEVDRIGGSVVRNCRDLTGGEGATEDEIVAYAGEIERRVERVVDEVAEDEEAISGFGGGVRSVGKVEKGAALVRHGGIEQFGSVAADFVGEEDARFGDREVCGVKQAGGEDAACTFNHDLVGAKGDDGGEAAKLVDADGDSIVAHIHYPG